MKEEWEQSKGEKANSKKEKQAKGVKAKNKYWSKTKKKQSLIESSQTERNTCLVPLEDKAEGGIQCSRYLGWPQEAIAGIPKCLDTNISDRY